MPCTVAIEFSSLRATSVSSCEGEAPGRAAITVTIGRSMSGKFWIRMALKAMIPASVSRMNSRIAGIGLRIDQAETFMGLLLRLGRLHHAHRIAVGEESAAARHHAHAGLEAAGNLDAVARAAAGGDLDLLHLAVGPDD